ncbi:carbonic anhydrase [Pseudomonas indica]|uniref:carbonic anhydrase n=1 Tax=Pseudomonas indica TaxID=137658 RepID=UPI003FD39A44
MRRFLLGAVSALSVSVTLAAEPTPPTHWSYQGENGPDHWAQMDPGFSTCALGKMQSPIDIRNAVKADLPEIQFDYTAGPAEVVNNGHTIQVTLPKSGSIDIGGSRYELLQFHFHTPSEEKVAGMAFPMVAHFVHKSADGQLAVVAVLIKEGHENPGLAKVLAALPTKEGESHPLEVQLNPADILPPQHGYYAFTGSLTTPPCSENVRWQVLKQPIELSHKQIVSFQHLYPMNARPTQPLNGRKIEESHT